MKCISANKNHNNGFKKFNFNVIFFFFFFNWFYFLHYCMNRFSFINSNIQIIAQCNGIYQYQLQYKVYLSNYLTWKHDLEFEDIIQQI